MQGLNLALLSSSCSSPLPNPFSPSSPVFSIFFDTIPTQPPPLSFASSRFLISHPQEARYCSPKCQKEHWTLLHKKYCGKQTMADLLTQSLRYLHSIIILFLLLLLSEIGFLPSLIFSSSC